jgi:cytidine deaminase
MELKELHLVFKEYGAKSELETEDNKLLKKAEEATSSSYSPYSHFRVGAAVLLENGEIITGSNQENAAYPSGLCAERVALFAAAAKFPGVAVKSVAITAKSDETDINQPVTPCGACRQVMIEFENMSNENIKVIMAGERGSILVSDSVKNLIPLNFDGNHLLKNK